MTTTMKKIIPLFAFIALLSSISVVQGAEVLTKARSTLQKWVETRQIIAQEKTTWLAEEKTLQDSIEFIKVEIKNLEEAITAANTDIGTQDNTQKVLQEDIKAKEEALAVIEVAVPIFEKKIRELATIFPAVFLEKVSTQLRRIPDPDSDRKLNVSAEDRIQNVISILKGIEYFNGVVTLSSELRESNGEISEVKTIYVGFGQAYFVDENQTTAGYGYPVIGKGWELVEMPEIAEAVHKAVLVADNRLPAVFVNVPVAIQQ
jgi:chromosome segregation ATPase